MFLNQIGLFNKQRYKRSGSSSNEEQLNKNLNLFIILLKKDTKEEDKINHIKETLQQGADINFKDANRGDNTLLHIAVKRGYSNIISFLLKQENIKVDLKNKEGKTPTDLAKGKPELIEIFEKFTLQSRSLGTLINQPPSISSTQHEESTDQQLGWNCFDVAIRLTNRLGITSHQPKERAEQAREKLVQMAIEKSSDSDYRKLLAPEISHAAALTVAAMNEGHFDSESDYLPSSMRTDELKNLYNQYSQFPDSDKAKQDFDDYCSREDIYRNYLQDYYRKNKWFAFQADGSTSMVDVTAKLLNIQITIYDNNQQIIHQTAGYGNTVWVNFNGVNHFTAIESNFPYSPNPQRPVNIKQSLQEENQPKDIQSILPPFAKNLPVDTELKLSRNRIETLIKSLVKNRELSNLQKLNSISDYPAPYLLAQFASKAYTDLQAEEKLNDYEKRLALPDGWKLLTTAANQGATNGYFGAAYWHPEYHQVVIAHRGTKPTNLGADWADVKGVVFNNYVAQMNSAATFAERITKALAQVSQELNIEFQLFFTGHSLGGWLAQITTFTTEYLHLEGAHFQKNSAPSQYHAHTVVFDSPGCAAMLSQMRDNFDLRYQRRSIELDALDITSYLSAPNRINTCNTHVGTLYRLFTDLSKLSWRERNTGQYNLEAHSLDRILQAFDPDTGQVRRDASGHLKLQEIVDWPISGSIRRGKEYKHFFEWANHLNDYHPDTTDERFQIETESGYYPVRYQTKLIDEASCSLSVFTDTERKFLERYQWLRTLPEFFKPQALFAALGRESQLSQERLQNFAITEDSIRCSTVTDLRKMIPYVKSLLRLFPDVSTKTAEMLSSSGVVKQVYQMETENYLREIDQTPLDFEVDSLGLEQFLNNPQQKIWHQIVNQDTSLALTWTYKIFEKIKQQTSFADRQQYTLLKLKRLLAIQQMADVQRLFDDSKHLLIIECKTLDVSAQALLTTLLSTVKKQQNVKLILITHRNQEAVRWIQQQAAHFNGYLRTEPHPFGWKDLSSNSQKGLLNTRIQIHGRPIILYQLLNLASPDGLSEQQRKQLGTLDAQAIIQLANVKQSSLAIGHEPLRLSDLEVAYMKRLEKIEPDHLRRVLVSADTSETWFVINGLGASEPEEKLLQRLQVTAESDKQVLQARISRKNIMIIPDDDTEQQFKRFCHDHMTQKIQMNLTA
ncbi:MAG: ankyrin repeat domain-containing protein (plasmid) [Candidatus Symbiodolus clandestinus]